MDIPIVSSVIEPLKAKAFAARPERNKHQQAFLKIIEARGRIDPSALVLMTQGVSVLAQPLRAMRLWLKGKISPTKTFNPQPIAGIERVKRLFRWSATK